MYCRVVVTQTHGMLHICRHAFQSVDNEFLERAFVLVGLVQHAHLAGFSVVVVACAAPRHLVYMRQFYTVCRSRVFQRVAQRKGFVHAAAYALDVEVGICDGAEESVDDKPVDLRVDTNLMFSECLGYRRDTPCYEQQQVHAACRGGVLAAHAFHYTPCASGCFLTLETKHLIFHICHCLFGFVIVCFLLYECFLLFLY